MLERHEWKLANNLAWLIRIQTLTLEARYYPNRHDLRAERHRIMCEIFRQRFHLFVILIAEKSPTKLTLMITVVSAAVACDSTTYAHRNVFFAACGCKG